MKIGAEILHVKSCSSTNDLAKEVALSGGEEGTVVISDEQTGGKGTKGRSWFSARKKGLYLSCILYPPHPRLSLLPLAAGLAANEAIFESVGIRARVKWPNDLIWGKKKLGGILCESSFLGNSVINVILGIGINLHHRRDDFPEEIRCEATSLRLITKKEVDDAAVLESLFKALNYWYGLHLRGENEKIIRSFQEHSVLPVGKKITVMTGKREVSGIYAGIDLQGNLILESKGERVSLVSGEIRLKKGEEKEG